MPRRRGLLIAIGLAVAAALFTVEDHLWPAVSVSDSSVMPQRVHIFSIWPFSVQVAFLTVFEDQLWLRAAMGLVVFT